MPPQGETVVDNFNRNNEPTLANPWASNVVGDSAVGMTLDANQILATNESYCTSYLDTPTYGPDCYAGCSIPSMHSGASSSLRVYFCLIDGAGTSAVDGYVLYVYADRLELHVLTNASSTIIGAAITTTPQNADKYLVERIGSNFEIWRHRSGSWTSMGTRSDSTHAGAGKVGLGAYDPGATGRYDDLMAGTISGAAAQLARPISTVSVGSWTDDAGGGTDLHSPIDEVAANDADYIRSSESPNSADISKVRLGPLIDPNVDTGHVVRYRYQKSATGGDQINLTVRLMAADGTTVIASQTHTDIDALTAGSFTLTGVEADAIPGADYNTGLVIQFEAIRP